MSGNCFIIAIDGKAASGKGTVSEKLASYFGFDYLDTGKIYRLLAYNVIQNGISYDDKERIISLIDEIDFTKIAGFMLHNDDISDCASRISIYPEVREKMNIFQKNYPINRKGVVIDGRDIGTVIFPNAHIKLFITADIEARAQRRFKQLQSMEKSVIYDEVLKELKVRDERDINRKVAPTRAASDAVVIDTTNLDIESVFRLSIALTEKAVKDHLAS